MTDPNQKSPPEQTAATPGSPETELRKPSETGFTTPPEKAADSEPKLAPQARELMETGKEKAERAGDSASQGLKACKETVARKTGSWVNILFKRIEKSAHNIVKKTEKAAQAERKAAAKAAKKRGAPSEKTNRGIAASKEDPSGKAQSSPSAQTAAKKVAAKKTGAKKQGSAGKTPAKKTSAKKTAAKKTSAKKTAAKKTAAKKTQS